MKVVIQRVSAVELSIAGALHASIAGGLLVFVGIAKDDDQADIDWIVKKVLALRIFADVEGKMNLSLNDLPDHELMLVSQFTLMASTKKGTRPSFTRSAFPDIARPMYVKLADHFVSFIENRRLKQGVFGADMQIALVNDGPVTIILDSKNKV